MAANTPNMSLKILLLTAALLSPAAAQKNEQHVMMPMRDAAKLSTYLCFPDGKGPWPVLYEQRYGNLTGKAAKLRSAQLASHGYVVAEQNFRGTQLSEGVYSAYRALGWGEHKDGYDSVEWLARQPWSTGAVATFGGSQAGYAQNYLAAANPPHLVAQYIQDGGLSMFHLGFRIGGITRPGRFADGMLPSARDPNDGKRDLEEQFRHPNYDEYWAEEDCYRHFADMNVPAIILASWYDFMSVGGIDAYIGRQHHGGPKAKGQQKLIVGPWQHGTSNKYTTKAGDLEYPANAVFDLDAELIGWLDHRLKGKPFAEIPTVRYYAMGAIGEPGAPGNVWRTSADWPIAAKDTSFYLRDGGRLGSDKPDTAAGSTEFLSNPLDPAPMKGRNYPAGKDGRAFEKHPDVRTFTSEVLQQPLEWTGKVTAEMYVSSSARDSDFIVRVSDVYPDGRSIMIIDSIRRARYRDSFEHPSLLTPGKVYKVAFDVGWLSMIFNRGHRVRVVVSSTAADFYEPNPNTGEALTIEPPTKTVTAKNVVYHNRQQASRVIAPVVQ